MRYRCFRSVFWRFDDLVFKPLAVGLRAFPSTPTILFDVRVDLGAMVALVA
jgi:hypothetical protein